MMNPKRKKIIKVFDDLIENSEFKNQNQIIEKVLQISRGKPILVEILVNLILLIEPDKESDLVKALNSSYKLASVSTLELLIRTALMSIAICWIMLGTIYHDPDVSWFRWIVGLGVVLLASVKIKNRMSLEQELYQLAIALLPNLGLLIFQDEISKLVATNQLFFFFVFTLSNSILSTMFMFLIDRVSSD